MKSIKTLFISILLFFVCITGVKANTINKIDINAYIDSSGNMHVTEVWEMVTNKDTEMYIEKLNMGIMTISDFSVSDEDQSYELKPTWDIYGSFDSKIHKYGINNKTNGDLELCWGISEYGSKRYTIKYVVNNAVFLTNDAQVLYVGLINKSSLTTKAYNVNITSDIAFSDSLPIWAFGYKGYSYVKDGIISMSNDTRRKISSNEYLTLLVQFPSNTFNVNSSNKYDNYKTFNEVLQAAKEGTFDNTKLTLGEIISNIFTFLYRNIYLIIIVVFVVLGVINSGGTKYKFGEAGKSIKMSEINAFRDIPCRKDIYRAYFISQAYSLNKKETDFFGTIFLKFMDQGKISTQKYDKKTLLGGTKQKTNIVLEDNVKLDNEIEEKMYNILLEASIDGVLEEDELKNWSKENYKKLLDWFEDAEEYGRNQYITDALVKKEKSKYLIDDKVKNDAIELAGLKKYLKEFTLMNEKEPMEVKLWKEYLMFAQIFGMADEVAKQFKKLYPEVLEEMVRQDFDLDSYVMMNHFSSMAISTAEGARRAAEAAARNYSSGGGGFSSGGGGGGSFGGGGSSGSR